MKWNCYTIWSELILELISHKIFNCWQMSFEFILCRVLEISFTKFMKIVNLLEVLQVTQSLCNKIGNRSRNSLLNYKVIVSKYFYQWIEVNWIEHKEDIILKTSGKVNIQKLIEMDENYFSDILVFKYFSFI